MSFVAFARSYGLELDYAIPDGRWHRTPTADKRKSKKNGAYIFDGVRGVVKNFATMADYAAYRDGARIGTVNKAELRARRVMAEADKKARQSEARDIAADMLKRATLQEHPYLIAKGFPEERGLVLDGELLIPMRAFSLYKQLNSLQRIAADGTKLFLPGGKAKGSVFIIGPFMTDERWLVEGYATGLSVMAGLRAMYRRAQTIVCFSSGNLAHVGRVVKALSVPAYVFADNDKSNAGREAAEETGLPWRMAPIEGYDANDYQREFGVHALAALLRDASRTEAARERLSAVSGS